MEVGAAVGTSACVAIYVQLDKWETAANYSRPRTRSEKCGWMAMYAQRREIRRTARCTYGMEEKEEKNQSYGLYSCITGLWVMNVEIHML